MQPPSPRRPAAPVASSPSPPPPPPHLPRPQSPPLPSALLPPKKRFLRNASTPIPTPPPPPPNAPAATAETLVLPTPSPRPPVADSGLLTPPPPPKAAEPSAPPIPISDAKLPSNPPPPTPMAAEPSTPPIPSAEAKLPSTPPSAPVAAAEPAPELKVRKRKVIKKVIVKVPKGTLAARKAAAAAASAAASADGAGARPNETLGDKGCNTGCLHSGCKEGQSSIKNCKLAAAAARAREALIKRKQLLLEGQTLAAKPAIGCNNAPVEGIKEGLSEQTLARKPAVDCNAPVEGRKEGLLEQTFARKPATDCNAPVEGIKEGLLEQTLARKPAVDCNAPVEGRKEGLLEQTFARKPAVDCNAPVEGRKEGLLEQTFARKPAIDCNAPVEGIKEGLLEQTLAEKPAVNCSAPVEEGEGMSEAESVRMKEVFVGGLHYDAKEEDVRAVFRKAGEITQVRVIPNTQTGKNKGYCFVQYREASHAKKAIAELGNVKICGKRCRTAALDGNNIEKKQKKEDVNIKGLLPKPVEKSKQNREKDTSNINQSDMAVATSETRQIAGDKKSSTNPDLLNVPREQATRRHRETVLAPIQGHHRTYSGLQRASSTLDNYSSDLTRSHSRPRHGSNTLYYVNPAAFPANAYGFLPASYYGVTRSSINSQIRRAGAHQPEQTYGRRQ